MENDRIHLLIVENDVVFSRLINFVFEDEPSMIQVKFASSLRIGLEYLSQESFDAIILDLYLPDSMGLGSIERIQQKRPDIPIVFLTARNDEKIKNEALNRGAKAYLLKDQVVSHLIPTILSIVSVQSRRS